MAAMGLALLLIPPLAGGLTSGLPRGFFEFPPQTLSIEHADFSPWIFGLFSLLFLLSVVALCFPRLAGFHIPEDDLPVERHRFPWWGKAGIGITVVAWIAAWGRFEWLGVLRIHTFFPLWLGYILTVDGWVHRRQGRSRASEAPGRLAGLFLLSAPSWWYFEYLNRFVQNWEYHGVENFSPLAYTAFASLCFSTVLPAVFETHDLLRTTNRFGVDFSRGPRVPPCPGAALIGIGLGVLGLAIMPAFPNELFWLTWTAPLLVLLGAISRSGQPTPLTSLSRGDWSETVTWAAAALVCGFFWELWNVLSFPKWTYHVPYAQALHLFEMPFPGYGGYLPFGLICWGQATLLCLLAGKQPINNHP